MIILAAIGIGVSINEVKKARETEFKTEIRSIQEKLRIYHQNATAVSETYKPENLQWEGDNTNPVNTGKVSNGEDEDTVEEILGNISDEIAEKLEIINGEIVLKAGIKLEEKKWAQEINVAVKGENEQEDIFPPVVQIDGTVKALEVTGTEKIVVPIKIIEKDSGINYQEFIISDIVIKVGGNVVVPLEKKLTYKENSNGEYKYILEISNIVQEGELTLNIPRGNILDISGNKNIETNLTPGIIINNTTLAGGTVIINNGEEYTNNINVTLTLNAINASQMYISNDNITPLVSQEGWEIYKKNKIHTVTLKDGTKTVYVWYKNNQNNISNVSTDTIILDTKGPSNINVKINNGVESTTNRNVTLNLTATGANYMYISESSKTPSIDDSGWITYAASKSYTLSEGKGKKVVYVWYKDNAGNITDRISASIKLM